MYFVAIISFNLLILHFFFLELIYTAKIDDISKQLFEFLKDEDPWARTFAVHALAFLIEEHNSYFEDKLSVFYSILETNLKEQPLSDMQLSTVDILPSIFKSLVKTPLQIQELLSLQKPIVDV